MSLVAAMVVAFLIGMARLSGLRPLRVGAVIFVEFFRGTSLLVQLFFLYFILPLYHVADATITLLRRLARGERVWEAHRSHFYQQATTNGFGVRAVVGRVAALNVALAALAGLSIAWPALWAQALCLGLAILLTASLLRAFATPRDGHG